MPRLLVFFVCLISLTASTAAAEQAYPYKAYVAVDNLEVRSGPGDDFYPTEKLQKGDLVEVHRPSGGGWCAIKPPKGSFSWISGRALRLSDDNLAEITQDNVAARVGSDLSEVRDVIQVRMRKGEVVEIRDSKDLPGVESQTWYKIAPPSGEFRFVLEKNLSKDRPREIIDDARPNDSFSSINTSRNQIETENPNAGVNVSSNDLPAELDRIDLELSMMVVEDPSAWSFDALRIRAESMLDRTDTAADRGKVRLFLNKVARFEDIKQRYDSVTAMRQQTATSNRFLSGLQRTMANAAAMADPEGQFDGVGQLQPVFSPKIGAPRYALVDEAGNVRYYITPAPGVNLQNYIGRQIGISGTRGYMPEQRAQHITARHVSSLETRIR